MTLASSLATELSSRALRIAAVAAFVLAVTHMAAYWVGHANGKASAAKADTAAVQRGYQAEARRVDQDIARGQKTGKAAVAATRRVDQYFNRLDQEASHDAHASIDDFELPADRLQRWRDANAGPLADTTATEPDHRAGASAAAGIGEAAGSGGESP